jgi:thioesterase domain-containing protein
LTKGPGEGPADVAAYLWRHIPLSAAMRIRVIAADPLGVSIEAPLEPNLNHHATAFGGSVAALAILTGWTLVHLRARAEGVPGTIVIQNSNVDYVAPIHGTFRAVTDPVEDHAWQRFVRGVTKHGKGRLRVSVSVFDGGVQAARFTGAYVALHPA